MEMTLEEFIWTTMPGVITQVTNMGVSRKGTETYTVTFQGDLNTPDEWMQCFYIVTDLQGEILSKQEFSPEEF